MQVESKEWVFPKYTILTSQMKSILEIFSYTGFIQGSLTGSLAVFHKKFNKPEFRILGLMAFLMGLDCLCQNPLVIANYPIVFWLNNGNLFLFGPLFYFIIKMVKSGVSLPLKRISIIPYSISRSGN